MTGQMKRKCDKNISIYMLQILDCFDLTTYIKNAFQYLQYLKINFQNLFSLFTKGYFPPN